MCKEEIIDKAFENYINLVFPDPSQIPDHQYTEMKRAFYAGFGELFIALSDPEVHGHDEGFSQFMDQVKLEIEAFFKSESLKEDLGI